MVLCALFYHSVARCSLRNKFNYKTFASSNQTRVILLFVGFGWTCSSDSLVKDDESTPPPPHYIDLFNVFRSTHFALNQDLSFSFQYHIAQCCFCRGNFALGMIRELNSTIFKIKPFNCTPAPYILHSPNLMQSCGKFAGIPLHNFFNGRGKVQVPCDKLANSSLRSCWLSTIMLQGGTLQFWLPEWMTRGGATNSGCDLHSLTSHDRDKVATSILTGVVMTLQLLLKPLHVVCESFVQIVLQWQHCSIQASVASQSGSSWTLIIHRLKGIENDWVLNS